MQNFGAEDEILSQDEDEEWRPIPGWEGYYSASSLGRIRRESRAKERRHRHPGRILSTRFHPKRRYCAIHMFRNGKGTDQYVQRLVAATFLGPRPEGLEVNHIDGDPRNNAAANLEYVTRAENLAHSVLIGTFGGLMHGRKSRVLKGLLHA